MVAAVTPKGERRRQALVEAAAALLLEGGFAAVRHRSVATRAELPLASTTYYFSSLDDLITCAVEFSGHAEIADMRSRLERVSHRRRGAESTAELIIDVLLGSADGDVRRNQLAARFERSVACARTPELRSIALRLRGRLDEVLADALRRCGRSVRPEQLRQLLGLVDGIAVHAFADSPSTPRAAVRAALVRYIDLLAPPIGVMEGPSLNGGRTPMD